MIINTKNNKKKILIIPNSYFNHIKNKFEGGML